MVGMCQKAIIILIIIILIIIFPFKIEENNEQVSPEEREFFVGELTNYIYFLAAPPLLLFLMVPKVKSENYKNLSSYNIYLLA